MDLTVYHGRSTSLREKGYPQTASLGDSRANERHQRSVSDPAFLVSVSVQ